MANNAPKERTFLIVGASLRVLSFMFLFLFINLNVVLYAQQSLEMGGASATNASDDPDSDNTGPTTEVIFPFIHNIDNPSDDVFTTYRPELTATITISNQQLSTTQDTDDDDSDGGGGTDDPEFTLFIDGGFTTGDNPASTIGWNNNSVNGGDSFTRFGEALDDVNLFNTITQSNPSNSNYASIESLGDGTTGSGITVSENRAIYLANNFEALRGQIVGLDGGSPTRFYMADLTITFNQPVNDPIIHFLGLGGNWFVTVPDDPSGSGESTQYTNSATIELELDEASSSSVTSISKLSGTSNFEVDDANKLIRNDADIPNVNDDSDLAGDFGVGSGSALINGDGITTLVFNLFVRGMNTAETRFTDVDGTTTDIVVANEGLNWAGGGTANNDSAFPELNFSSDSWMMSISTQVDPDEQLLTTADCFRMLSAPVEGTTYGDLVGDFWIQGQTITGTGVDHTDGTTDPNVFLLPADGSTGAFSGWDELPNLDATIDPGTGFLISVFEDDDFEDGGIQGGFDKTITVTGSENAPPTVSGSAGTMNSGADAFSLLGNPYKSTIDWDNIQPSNTLDVRNAVYVYDREISGYRSYVNDNSGEGGFGSLAGGLIEPFQGFFVQNEAAIDEGGPEVDFTGAKAATDGSGSFYGKGQSRNSFVSFELNGESLYNTMWIWFSNKGSLDNTNGDALELTPLAHDYAMMGTRKTDDTIYDIGHYPIPDEQFEIPVSFEATRSGRYTITAKDMNLSMGADLYFIDLDTEESIRIDENFRYEFSTEQVAKKSANDDLRRCTVGGPQKAKTIASADRFLISTSPKEFESELPAAVALDQNFPNPFNPTTQITYQLPQESEVRLEVFDMSGRQVTTLVNERMSAGTHTVNFDARNLSSGVYMYRLQTGSAVLTKKLTLIK